MGHPQQHGALLPKRIILVHHGESEGNLSPSGQATTPDHKIPLTPLGVAQARAAGDRLRTLVAGGGGEWRVYFYASPYKQTQSMLREIGRSFRRGRVIGAREECRIREQDFWNSQVVGRMKVVKEARERFGRFFYRFPEGE
ncbi:phosphoglycerate mutase-like protein AT74H [Eucalyptus grandis]|uniref:phosphoglycerate mutase-like protein AT74H n=1 Tax=Eucalyptus grandis TaxID=71139 RepID=UPI00192E8C78|nr:phosphoglycerate mutase-like protein AT74H [Eucalyptus grandis]